MQEMPRPRPQYLLREVNRHGQPVWYVRIGKGKRIRIRAEYGTPEFSSAYEAAREGREITKRGPMTGTLAWLYEKYRETTAWQGLSQATRRQRENILAHVMKASGAKPYAAIERSAIVAGRDRRRKTPAQARNFLDAMRGLFRWALDAGYVRTDPTAGVKNPARPKDGGFPDWTEENVLAYEERWPLGTKERVWLDVLLYTGLRRGDAVRIGKQHVRNGIAAIKTEKNKTEVVLPILPVLQTTLDAGPTGDLAFIVGESGQPFKKESFGNAFRVAARDAGVRKSAHGIRKIAATRAANRGATVAQLEAIFGWQGGGMASLYTRKADRERLAKSAMHLLVNDAGTSIPAPEGQVRASGEKAE